MVCCTWIRPAGPESCEIPVEEPERRSDEDRSERKRCALRSSFVVLDKFCEHLASAVEG